MEPKLELTKEGAKPAQPEEGTPHQQLTDGTERESRLLPVHWAAREHEVGLRANGLMVPRE